MIFIILIIFVLLLIISEVLTNTTECEVLPFVCLSGGIIGTAVSIIALVVLSFQVSKIPTLDAKIEMYQEENTKIEQQIAAAVSEYQQYEKDVFATVAPESSITLVALYPELKADTLVQKQIDVYIANNEKIKELKEEKINGNIMKWWLYFGGGENGTTQK